MRFLLALIAIVACTGAAYAQTATPPTETLGGVDFTPTALQIITVLATIATAIVGVVGKAVTSLIASKVNLNDTQFEALLNERLNDIIYRAIDAAEAWAKREVTDPKSGLKNVEFDNIFLDYAVKTVMNNAPGILEYFNISQERLKTMILSRLNAYIKTPSQPDTGEVEIDTGIESVQEGAAVPTA